MALTNYTRSSKAKNFLQRWRKRNQERVKVCKGFDPGFLVCRWKGLCEMNGVESGLELNVTSRQQPRKQRPQPCLQGVLPAVCKSLGGQRLLKWKGGPANNIEFSLLRHWAQGKAEPTQTAAPRSCEIIRGGAAAVALRWCYSLWTWVTATLTNKCVIFSSS